MLSKSQISFVNSLHQKKFRKQEQQFIAEGEKVVRELLDSSLEVRKIFSTESFFNENNARKKKGEIEWVLVTEAELKKISALTTSQEVLSVAAIPVYNLDDTEIDHSISLVLDDVSDPGNLGTIIRIADWFGIKNIICSDTTADCYNPKVVQASMGSLFRTRIHYVNLPGFLEKTKQLNRLPVYGTSLNGENIYSANLSSSGLIVLGNESKGIKEDLKKYITSNLYIPPFASQGNALTVDSLNVASAAAIVCSEFRRRKTELNK